ncbi:MAG: hypothetical protein MI717_05225 [Spirochaetales bacterium]|nr:hypothetical protein [Spirochaetales bacterium]
MERCRQGQFRTASRDQGAVDLLQAFALYVKAHAEHRRRLGRPAYIVADAVAETSESLGWFQSLMTEFLEKECLRLVVIQDGDGVDFDLPFPKDSLEFPIPEPEDWKQIVDEASVGTPPSPLDLRDLQESCGASLYRLFHGLLAWERGEPVRFGSPDPGESLVESLDEGTRITLFLAHAASGLADRSFICERNGEDEEARYQEEARYDGLLALGLIREDPDGRVRLLPGGPTAAFALDDQKALAAQEFGAYLFQRYALGAPVDLFRLFRYLEQWGPHQQAIAALDLLVEGLLDNRRLRAAGILLNGPPMATADLGSGETEALQNVVGAARLRYVLLTGDAEGARNLVREGTLSLISGRGDYSDRFRLNHARFSYATGRWDDALAASKEALFAFQKSGNHEGETHSHLELALSLLAGGKVRDAMEHFSISRRIGTQVSASWGVLRASAMEVVSHFLFGNIPRAQRECQEYRNVARREGRRDLWLLLTLLSVRISWELGRYGEAASYAEEGRQTANFYGLSSEERVMRLWRARSLMTQGYAEGRRQLLSETETDALREARAFLSEAAWLGGNVDEAAEHIALAAGAERKSVRLQGEADDWSDGFFPLEGRLADSGGSLDVLDERIRAFSVFLGHDEASYEQLDHLLERDGRRIPRPYSYQYAIWASRLAEDDELSTRYVSRSFNDLQIRASRFDDNQTKHRWLSMNPWNKFIMEDAQKRKFL